MRQFRKGGGKARLLDILMYGCSTSKDPDMPLPETGLAVRTAKSNLPNYLEVLADTTVSACHGASLISRSDR